MVRRDSNHLVLPLFLVREGSQGPGPMGSVRRNVVSTVTKLSWHCCSFFSFDLIGTQYRFIDAAKPVIRETADLVPDYQRPSTDALAARRRWRVSEKEKVAAVPALHGRLAKTRSRHAERSAAKPLPAATTRPNAICARWNVTRAHVRLVSGRATSLASAAPPPGRWIARK